MLPLITVAEVVDPKAAAVIRQGLRRYNREQAGYADTRGLNVLVSDPTTHEVVGGLLGHTSLGLGFIDLIFLPGHLRGQDLGSRIMAAAEDEARRRGCRGVVLYTLSFQAPAFYEKRGYRVFGKIDCDPPGTSRLFMVKDLR